MARFALLAMAGLVLALPSPTSARTWYVLPDGTGDAPTIHAALDSAAVFDSVLVAAGTYTATVSRQFLFTNPTESVTLAAAGFLKQAVTLVSEAGPGATTIAVPGGENVHCLVAAQGFGTVETRVVGFRFEGLSGGAAVFAREMWDNWWIHVEDCIVEDVDGGEQAGGFWSMRAGNARIVDCSFSNVTGGPVPTRRASVGVAESPASTRSMIVQGCSFANDGRVVVRSGLLHLDVLDCTFDGNLQRSGIFSDARRTTIEDCDFQECLSYAVWMVANAHSFGAVRRCTFRGRAGHPSIFSAGIHMITVSESYVEDCRFEFCQAPAPGGAAAVEILSPSFDGSTYIRNNVFVDVVSDVFGAVYCRDVGGEITGNTFFRCHNAGPSEFGSAIHVDPVFEPGLTVDVHHNIFAECSGAAAVSIASPGAIVESCNDYWSNADGDVDGFTMDGTSFVLDPLFCDSVANDFHLRSDSPCAPPGVTGCGLVGALPVGCGPVSVEDWSWGQIKAAHR